MNIIHWVTQLLTRRRCEPLQSQNATVGRVEPTCLHPDVMRPIEERIKALKKRADLRRKGTPKRRSDGHLRKG